jgi:hypothetical protein
MDWCHFLAKIPRTRNLNKKWLITNVESELWAASIQDDPTMVGCGDGFFTSDGQGKMYLVGRGWVGGVTSEESVEGGELEGGAEVKRVEKAVFDGRGGRGVTQIQDEAGSSDHRSRRRGRERAGEGEREGGREARRLMQGLTDGSRRHVSKEAVGAYVFMWRRPWEEDERKRTEQLGSIDIILVGWFNILVRVFWWRVVNDFIPCIANLHYRHIE